MTVYTILSAAAQELTLEVFGNEHEFMQKLNEVMNSLDATPEEVDHEVKP